MLEPFMGIKQTKRFASEILKCGQNKVWLDPQELTAIKSAASREKVRELIDENIIFRKPNAVHSRYHTRKRQAEVAKGRHRGPGKVHGPKTVHDPPKERWMRKIREMRATLKELRARKEITSEEHHKLYAQAKGNFFKNNKSMLEFIAKKKEDEKRLRDLSEQAAALRLGKE